MVKGVLWRAFLMALRDLTNSRLSHILYPLKNRKGQRKTVSLDRYGYLKARLKAHCVL